jgi:leucyl-tRNA synthetase
MPQWAGSSWYFLRFCDPRNNDELASREALARWPRVDMYVGGAEHAVLHLLYARFWTLALHNAGVIPWREPFARLRTVGLVRGEDGQKMSKSRGNVVNPDQVIEQYGADALRVYAMFMGPFDASIAWDTHSIAGVARFLDRVWQLITTRQTVAGEVAPELRREVERTNKRVREGIEQFKFNTAVAALMALLNRLEKEPSLPAAVADTYLLLLYPLAPHLAHELWQRLGRTTALAREPWPTLAVDILQMAPQTVAVQVNGKVRGSLVVQPGVLQEQVEEQARRLANVARHLEGTVIAKTIYVPNRVINFIVQRK